LLDAAALAVLFAFARPFVLAARGSGILEQGRAILAFLLTATAPWIWIHSQITERRHLCEFSLIAARTRKEFFMLWAIFVVILILWLLGLITGTTVGGLVHILLILAVIVLIIEVVRIVSRRRA
jgi:hypothetical protein